MCECADCRYANALNKMICHAERSEASILLIDSSYLRMTKPFIIQILFLNNP
jgi:hypothetical protein